MRNSLLKGQMLYKGVIIYALQLTQNVAPRLSLKSKMSSECELQSWRFRMLQTWKIRSSVLLRMWRMNMSQLHWSWAWNAVSYPIIGGSRVNPQRSSAPQFDGSINRPDASNNVFGQCRISAISVLPEEGTRISGEGCVNTNGFAPSPHNQACRQDPLAWQTEQRVAQLKRGGSFR